MINAIKQQDRNICAAAEVRPCPGSEWMSKGELYNELCNGQWAKPSEEGPGRNLIWGTVWSVANLVTDIDYSKFYEICISLT